MNCNKFDLHMERSKGLLHLKSVCDMHVVCESGDNIHTFLHPPVQRCSVSVPRFSGKLIKKKNMLHFIFYNLVRILQPQNLKLDFLGGLIFKNNIHNTVTTG